ncbi:hypothetical protein [uncultured Ruminococcus sp.]|uniref:hypothetical protein n=1 Tax=uncultured Ruminococcus sp. TaxID=165186 RepID=UPI0025FD758E|nr:hypothetical protein [uncultured Ruminococcus sp.]
MGFFSWIADKLSDAKDWVLDRVDDVKDFLFGRKYDSSKVSDQVSVDAALAKFREEHSPKVKEAEDAAMNTIKEMFAILLKTVEKYEFLSDLSSLITYQQQQAEWKLKGTIISYIQEHLSKNNPDFVKILKMDLTPQKKEAIDAAFENSIQQAYVEFGKQLTNYTGEVINEFEERLNNKIKEQERQADWEINELEKTMSDKKTNMVDIDKIEDECAPAMEASQSIITVLNKAVI